MRVPPVGRPEAEPPPFGLPGRHFAASAVFLLAGSGMLARRAAALAAGAFSDPGVVAATHLLTLGWITTTILGALYQFLPVALGASIRWRSVAEITWGAWVAGVTLFAAGMGLARPGLHLPGAVLLGIAVLLLCVNLGATLPRARRGAFTARCVAGAAFFLLGGWVLGTLLAVNLGTGILGATRFTVLTVHLHVAAGGWVLLVVIGVAHRLLPMFLLSHGASHLPERVAAVLVAGGTVLLLLSEHLLPVGVIRFALALLAAGALAFVLQGALHFGHRRRPALDPGMRLVAASLVFLGLAALLGLALLAGLPSRPGTLTAYGLLLVPGGLGLFVAGHFYRIVPFLTWFHRFGPVAGRREVPAVSDLYRRGPAHLAGGLMAGGVALMAAGALLGREMAAGAGSVAFTAGASVMALQMARVARSRPS